MFKSEHQARKRFGQNFLVDENIIRKIVASIHVKATDQMIEIGPGQGALTERLLNLCSGLQAIELDRDLIPILKGRFAHFEQFIIHEADALSFNFASLVQAQPLRVVGNLPYNISTPLIFHLLSFKQCILDMHFMLQYEVVERMAAEPGTKDYGRLSVMCQYYCKVEYLFDVGPQCFSPVPKVNSAIVRLVPHAQPKYQAHDVAKLDTVVKAAFSQRRKTLRNALKMQLNDEHWVAVDIDPQRRPETLSVQEFVNIANYLTLLPTP